MTHLAINQLSKSYNKSKVFGAGKTTLMKILTGLIYPDNGTFSVCGIESNPNDIAIRQDIGSVIEEPKPYLYLTGYQNMQLIARLRNSSKQELDELSDLVGLSNRIQWD